MSRQDRRLSTLIASDPLPLCTHKALCNALTQLLPDRASHHPRSIWFAPSSSLALLHLSVNLAHGPTWSVSLLKTFTLALRTYKFVLVSLCVFIHKDCVCVHLVASSKENNQARNHTERARRNVFKNIQNNQQGGVAPLTWVQLHTVLLTAKKTNKTKKTIREKDGGTRSV